MADTSAVAANMLYLRERAVGGTTIKAAGLVAASEQGSGVIAGRGWIEFQTTIAAIEVASNDELYIIDIEANTADTTGTWVRIGTLFAGGAQEFTGRDTDDTTGTITCKLFNPYDYQVRYNVGVVGTIATGINVAISAFPG
jgi:hypothetical protein